MEIRRLFDIAPTADNPRNSEGSFLRLADGRIAYAYSRYSGNGAYDGAYCEVAVMFSSDNGETFTEPEILVRPNSEKGETNCMSVSLAELPNGDCGLFYLVKHEKNGLWSEVILRRSSDCLKTLGEEIRVAPDGLRDYYVINNDRILRTKDDTLIVPVALHRSTMGNGGGREFVDSRAMAEFFASYDGGYTWKRISDTVALSAAYSTSGLQEPGIIELNGGTLYSYFRTDLGRHYESVSIDGGKSWFDPRPSKFTAPCSPLLIKQNPYTGEFFAIWNPISPSLTAERDWSYQRTPFVIARSKDGVNFSYPEILENEEEAGYCYPALYFVSENEALLAYCAGETKLGDSFCLVRTRVVKLTV